MQDSSKYSKELIDLLLQMLKRDPNERIGIGEVWSMIDSLKEVQNQMSQMEFPSVRNAQQKTLSMMKSVSNLNLGMKPESLIPV